MGLKTIDVRSSKKDFIPGPGQYDTSDFLNSRIKAEPSFSIGTGARADLANIKEM
jgi:Sperm-tail PG-rich repeat